jgi:hypothetical protein
MGSCIAILSKDGNERGPRKGQESPRQAGARPYGLTPRAGASAHGRQPRRLPHGRLEGEPSRLGATVFTERPGVVPSVPWPTAVGWMEPGPPGLTRMKLRQLRACLGLREARLEGEPSRLGATLACPAAAQARRGHGWPGGRETSAGASCSGSGGARRRPRPAAPCGSARRPRSCPRTRARSHPPRRR